MRLSFVLATTVAIVSLAACATTATLTVSEQAAGEAMWEDRCQGCHVENMPGTPSRQTISTLGADYIYMALTSGKMSDMAGGMTDAQIRLLAKTIAGR